MPGKNSFVCNETLFVLFESFLISKRENVRNSEKRADQLVYYVFLSDHIGPVVSVPMWMEKSISMLHLLQQYGLVTNSQAEQPSI